MKSIFHAILNVGQPLNSAIVVSRIMNRTEWQPCWLNNP
uniref:Uncharacterized protein n=1 Tax=Arundo donax TaxID=35708 RepID=A0A0A9AE41_ARUDO